jgi:putative DNA primase/helicase
MGEYLESHAQRIYSFSTRNNVEAAKTLITRIAKGKLSQPFTLRDVYRPGWTGLETQSKAQTAIELLLEYRHVYSIVIETGGRPTTHYFKNDGVKS